VRGIIRAVGRHLAERAKAIAPEVGQTLQAKAVQGSAELGSALFTGHAYHGYAAENAHRAQFQSREQSQELER
jgi:hypothetical protein